MNAQLPPFSEHFPQAGLPDFWKAIALRLWPAYYNPEVRTEKNPIIDYDINTYHIVTKSQAEWMCEESYKLLYNYIV